MLIEQNKQPLRNMGVRIIINDLIFDRITDDRGIIINTFKVGLSAGNCIFNVNCNNVTVSYEVTVIES